jgi:predicted component of type VI protein secretion system
MGLHVRVRFRSPDGSVQGERVVAQMPVRVGRNLMNDCPIAHPFVSEFHAIIDVVNGQLSVRDLNSRNGIYGQDFTRLPAGVAVPLASLGNTFILARALEVTVEAFDQSANVGQRASNVNGSILGNQAALGAWPPAGAPPPPPLPAIGPPYPPQPPVAQPSLGVASLPPLSMVAGSMVVPPQPVYRAPSTTPPPADAQSINYSLPGLPPLPGAGSVLAPAGSVLAPAGFDPGLPPLAPRGASPRSPLPPTPGGASRQTQHLSMSTELLAMLGLRELASSLVPGVPLETTGDVARLLTKLHDVIEVFCRCFIALRDSHAQFVSSTDVARAQSRQLNKSPTAIRVDTARDAASLAQTLLDWRNQDFDAPQSVERTLVDVIMHHAAMMEGVMRGVEALLGQLAPEEIERSVKDDAVAAVFGRTRALWQAYASRYNEVSSEARRFDVVFGPEFADSYREYMSRQPR